MKKGDVVRMNEVVKIKVGEFAGLAGVVEAVEGANVAVHISGSKNGEPVDVHKTYNEKALGRVHE